MGLSRKMKFLIDNQILFDSYNPRMNEFSERLAYALDCRGWTQKKLADCVYTTSQSVNQWVKGIATPKDEKIRAVAKALQCNYVWLATGYGDPFATENTNDKINESQATYSYPKNLNSLGDRIKYIIQNNLNKITQRELAPKFGVSAQTITNWKRGKISEEHLVMLCDMADADIDWVRNGYKASATDSNDEIDAIWATFKQEIDDMPADQAQETVKIALSLIEMIKKRK